MYLFAGKGLSSNSRGWGRLYWTEILLTIWNQDFEEGLDLRRELLAIEVRGLSSKLQIMLKRERMCRWSRATKGRDPARNKI